MKSNLENHLEEHLNGIRHFRWLYWKTTTEILFCYYCFVDVGLFVCNNHQFPLCYFLGYFRIETGIFLSIWHSLNCSFHKTLHTKDIKMRFSHLIWNILNSFYFHWEFSNFYTFKWFWYHQFSTFFNILMMVAQMVIEKDNIVQHHYQHFTIYFLKIMVRLSTFINRATNYFADSTVL